MGMIEEKLTEPEREFYEKLQEAFNRLDSIVKLLDEILETPYYDRDFKNFINNDFRLAVNCLCEEMQEKFINDFLDKWLRE